MRSLTFLRSSGSRFGGMSPLPGGGCGFPAAAAAAAAAAATFGGRSGPRG